MQRIDRETVRKILDTADIVEVVSDFVHLKKRGANYVGLCPFHNERTPSFSVSKSKGICKCFSCGKGGSPVNFIMELEQMSYNEALRYLANKYHIEIKEHEMSREEQEAEDDRQSMFAINDFAMKFFESTMTDTDAGRDIGMSYFRQRGINDAMIKRFHLGYSPEGRTELHDAALKKGFNERFLLETGLCYRTERGTIQDRFRGRVIYPVHTVSGKVIAFGGRTLRKDKDVAKYVNSPESAIYKKSNELYGLYQAKKAIVQKDKCILVEGYMDVISMHQSGVENVVASSGTSLTEGQIRLIHRFTENITVIYDSDAAGIKASLRGIDMLLAEGLNVKVLLLPDGDDPDSFAQAHSSSEVEDYLARNETDFIAFKTRILLEGAKDDPIERSRVITSIVRSIAVIPDEITRTVYIGECARSLSIDEKVLSLQTARFIAENREKEARERERERNRINAGLPPEPADPAADTVLNTPHAQTAPEKNSDAAFLRLEEKEVIKLAVRYGMVRFDEFTDERTHKPVSLSVLDYIDNEFAIDNITFANADFRRIFDEAHRIAAENWDEAWREHSPKADREIAEKRAAGIDSIRRAAEDIADIETREKKLEEELVKEREQIDDAFCQQFLATLLMSSSDDATRRLTLELTTEQPLSKIHSKFQHLESERERLVTLLPEAVLNLKNAIVRAMVKHLKEELNTIPATDTERINANILRQMELQNLIKPLAKMLGDRTLHPRR